MRPNPALPGYNSDRARNSILHCSITPRAGFEDEDEDEDEKEGSRTRLTKKKRPEVRALLEVRIMS